MNDYSYLGVFKQKKRKRMEAFHLHPYWSLRIFHFPHFSFPIWMKQELESVSISP